MAYELLTQPLTVKKTTFPNRVVLAPIQTNYAAKDGASTERLVNFHKNIAAGDVGLSIVGATAVSSVSKLGGLAVGLFEDAHIGPVRELFDAIRDAGSVPAVQICHGGRVLHPKLAGGDVSGFASQQPAGFIGDAGDFGSIAAFVCSEQAKFLTGLLAQPGGIRFGVVPGHIYDRSVAATPIFI